jgi:hypothetical protein
MDNLAIVCTRCNGNVIQRITLDEVEKYCVNCGFNQVPTITPDKALAKESHDFNVRTRSNGWKESYVELRPIYISVKEENRELQRLQYNRKAKARQQKAREQKRQEAKQLDTSFYGNV